MIRILKRRKWEILLPTLGIFLVTVIVALSWPLTYRSTSTILNLKNHEEKSTGAPKLIEGEGKKIQSQLAELDGKIAAFKSRSLNSLPEQAQLKLQTMDRNEQTINQLNDQLHALKKKERSLQNQLTGTLPDLNNSDRERLNELLRTYVKLRFHYSELHPDMIKVKREIADMERRLGSAHRQNASGGKSDNPANVALEARLAGTQSDIRSTQRQISLARSKRDSDRNRTETGLWTEEQYELLLIKRTNLQAKLDDLMKKHKDARSDRFTVIDPSRLPEEPARPNTPIMLLIGLMLGMGAGVGTAFVKELTDKSAHSAEDLASASHLNVLAAIPEIVTEEDRQKVMKKRSFLLMIAGAGIVCGLLFFIS